MSDKTTTNTTKVNDLSQARVKAEEGNWAVLTEPDRQVQVTERVVACERTKYQALLDIVEIRAAADGEYNDDKNIKDKELVVAQMNKRIMALMKLTNDGQLSR